MKGVCTKNTVTLNGHYNFDPYAPDSDLIQPMTLANSLSKLCRYGGHCDTWYSVAEHSVNVYRLSGHVWGLFHDAAEGLGLGDIVRPIKHRPGMADYKRAEALCLMAVARRFNLPWPIPPEVLHADEIMLIAEAETVWNEPPEWTVNYPAPTEAERKCIKIEGLLPGEARWQFLSCLRSAQRVLGFAWSLT